MGKLPKNEPYLKSFEIKMVISKEFKDYPYRPDCSVEPFKSDGPLVLLTGRVSPQKGIANIFSAIPYVTSDVYSCPSKWEPFGIVALEAMASKIPVVATYVGGLMESMLHLEDHPNDGTGLLCPNNDVDALKFALVSLITTMQIAEEKKRNPNLTIKDFKTRIVNISHSKLRKQVEKDLLFGEKIRNNALNRVERKFRWETVSQKLKKIYLSLNY